MLTLRYIIWQCLVSCHPLTILAKLTAFKHDVDTSKKNMGIHITKTNRLMLFRGKIGVCFDNYTRQINSGRGKNKELNVKSML
jgi:hypothetical protein